jgi:hypothetical protein
MNKYNFWGVVGAAATFLTIFGMWAKLTHQAYADMTLTIGMWTLAVCAAVYVYFMFTNLRKK